MVIWGVDPISDKLPSGWEKVPLQSLAKGGRVQRISNTHGLKGKTSETMGFSHEILAIPVNVRLNQAIDEKNEL